MQSLYILCEDNDYEDKPQEAGPPFSRTTPYESDKAGEQPNKKEGVQRLNRPPVQGREHWGAS